MNKPIVWTIEEIEWGFILLLVQNKFPAPEAETQSRKDNLMMKGPDTEGSLQKPKSPALHLMNHATSGMIFNLSATFFFYV